MASFEKIPVSGEVTAEVINRIQQNIADAVAASGSTVTVAKATAPQYTIGPNDDYVLVASRGGVVKVVAPKPLRTRAVTIRATDAANAVTLVRADASAFASGETVVAVTSVARIVSDGVTWWVI